MKVIDADALMTDICDSIDKMTEVGIPVDGEWLWKKLNHAIKHAPTIETERKKGKWERHYSRPNVYKDLYWHCSECGYKSSDNWADKWNYCPNCGCKMER